MKEIRKDLRKIVSMMLAFVMLITSVQCENVFAIGYQDATGEAQNFEVGDVLHSNTTYKVPISIATGSNGETHSVDSTYVIADGNEYYFPGATFTTPASESNDYFVTGGGGDDGGYPVDSIICPAEAEDARTHDKVNIYCKLYYMRYFGKYYFFEVANFSADLDGLGPDGFVSSSSSSFELDDYAGKNSSTLSFTSEKTEDQDTIIKTISLSTDNISSNKKYENIKIDLAKLGFNHDLILYDSLNRYAYNRDTILFKNWNDKSYVKVPLEVQYTIDLSSVESSSNFKFILELGDKLDGGKIYKLNYFQEAIDSSVRYSKDSGASYIDPYHWIPFTSSDFGCIATNYNNDKAGNILGLHGIGYAIGAGTAVKSANRLKVFVDNVNIFDINKSIPDVITRIGKGVNYVSNSNGDKQSHSAYTTHLYSAYGSGNFAGECTDIVSLKLPAGKTYYFQGLKPVYKDGKDYYDSFIDHGSYRTGDASDEIAIYFSSAEPTFSKVAYHDLDTFETLIVKPADDLQINDSDREQKPKLKAYDFSKVYDASGNEISLNDLTKDTAVYVKQKECKVTIEITDEDGEKVSGHSVMLTGQPSYKSNKIDTIYLEKSTQEISLLPGKYQLQNISTPGSCSEATNYTQDFTVADGASEMKVSFTYKRRKKSIPIIKQWVNDTAENRPDSVEVSLLRNNKVYKTTTLSANDNWQYTFADVPIYDENNVRYNYRLHEKDVDGYFVRYKHSNAELNKDQIINTVLPDHYTTTEISVVDDSGNALAGANMKLLDENDDLVWEWESAESPETIIALEPGEYTIHQVSSSLNYFKSEDKKITVLDTSDTQTFSVTNKKGVFLKIQSVAKGTEVDDSDYFAYSVHFDENIGGTATIINADGTQSTATVNDNNNTCDLRLNVNDEKQILLPIGTKYSVTLGSDPAYNKYKFLGSTNNEGIINEPITSTFSYQKDDWFQVRYFGVPSAEYGYTSLIFTKFAMPGESGALTAQDLKEHPEIQKYNYGFEKYLKGSKNLPDNIKNVTKDEDVQLKHGVIITYKDADTKEVIHSDLYESGKGKVDPDWSSSDFDGYEHILLYESRGTYYIYSGMRTDLDRNVTVYLRKKEGHYKVRVHVVDSDGNSLSDRFTFFRHEGYSTLGNYYNFVYDKDTDSFISDSAVTNSTTVYYNCDWSQLSSVGSNPSYPYSGCFYVYWKNNGKEYSEVSSSSGLFSDNSFTTNVDTENKVLDITCTVPSCTVTDTHEYHDGPTPSASIAKTVTTVTKYYKDENINSIKKEIPGYRYYTGSASDYSHRIRGDETGTFIYVKDEVVTNGIIVTTVDIDEDTLSNSVDLYKDETKVNSFNTGQVQKTLADGEYKLVIGSQPIGTVTVTDSKISFEKSDADGIFELQSANVEDNFLSIKLKKKSCLLKIVDEINGDSVLRECDRVPIGSSYNYQPLTYYTDIMYDSPESYTGTANSDETFVFKYSNKIANANSIEVQIFDINDVIHGSDTVKLDAMSVPVTGDGSYKCDFLPNGVNELTVNSLSIGMVVLDHTDTDNDEFILSDDCKKYSLKSTNVDDNKFSIVLTTNASEVTVVDSYDGEDHERQVDKYAIGDAYSYEALDLDGYDVIGASEQQGTADNDKVTVTFSYKKHDSADPTPDPTPDTPDTPKPDPKPDPTPSTPDDKPSTPSTPDDTPSTPSTPDDKPDTKPDTSDTKPDTKPNTKPDTKPDTKPSTPDVKPDDNPSTPDTKPDESNLKPETIHKMDLPLLLAKGKGGDKQIFLSWLNVSDADGYDVYWSYCDGKHNFKKFATLKKGKTSTTFRKYKKNGKTYFSLLDNNRKYKFFVTAYKMVNGKKIHLKKSNYLHVAMSSSNMTNAKKILVNKTSVSLVKGKSFTIKPRIRYERLFKKPVDHANMYRYYTTNKKIAKVSQSGKITAKKKGSCYVYVIANNGVYKKIKITVK